MTTTPSAISVILEDTGLVVTNGISWVGNFFEVIISNPLLLIPIGFSILGIVVKLGKKFIK